MQGRQLLFFALLIWIPLCAFTLPGWMAATASFGIGNPDNLKGARASVQWHPTAIDKKVFSVYFELSGAYWQVQHPSNRSLVVGALAPVIRLYFTRTATFSPYFEASSGPAYLSKTWLGSRNLGGHWTFQDILGWGATFGKNNQFDFSTRFLHYSNANLAPTNAGIDVLVLATAGYYFST